MRRAFTLLELLVVMGIMIFVAALFAAYYPRTSLKISTDRAASDLQGYLAQARSMAKRDQIPTGLRLLSVGGIVTQMQWIQGAEDWKFDQTGQVQVAVTMSGTTPTLYRCSAAPGSPVVFNENNAVQVGDFASFYSGPARRIIAVTATTFDMYIGPGPNYGEFPNYSPTANYIIKRGARAKPSEKLLDLPAGTCIDLNPNAWYSDPLPSSPVANAVDILFDPKGGAYLPGNHLRLWVRDASLGAAWVGFTFPGNQSLVSIIARSGLVASHPVNETIDPLDATRYQAPYAFTTDGRASGL